MDRKKSSSCDEIDLFFSHEAPHLSYNILTSFLSASCLFQPPRSLRDTLARPQPRRTNTKWAAFTRRPSVAGLVCIFYVPNRIFSSSQMHKVKNKKGRWGCNKTPNLTPNQQKHNWNITVFWINNLKSYMDDLKKILTNLLVFIAGLTALLLQKNHMINTNKQK